MILAVDLPGDQISGLLAVILSAGAALFVTAWFNGLTKWRSTPSASEARAIQNIERWGVLQEKRAERAEERVNKAAEALDAERQYNSELERIIIRELGRDKLPKRPPIALELSAE
jgi:hypothetical protein